MLEHSNNCGRLSTPLLVLWGLTIPSRPLIASEWQQVSRRGQKAVTLSSPAGCHTEAEISATTGAVPEAATVIIQNGGGGYALAMMILFSKVEDESKKKENICLKQCSEGHGTCQIPISLLHQIEKKELMLTGQGAFPLPQLRICHLSSPYQHPNQPPSKKDPLLQGKALLRLLFKCTSVDGGH